MAVSGTGEALTGAEMAVWWGCSTSLVNQEITRALRSFRLGLQRKLGAAGMEEVLETLQGAGGQESAARVRASSFPKTWQPRTAKEAGAEEDRGGGTSDRRGRGEIC